MHIELLRTTHRSAFLTGQLRALYCSWLPGLSVLPRSLSSSEKNLGLEVYLFFFLFLPVIHESSVRMEELWFSLKLCPASEEKGPLSCLQLTVSG